MENPLHSTHPHNDAARAFQRKAIATAHTFYDWSATTGEGLTFSTFVNTFGYQDEDGKQMYEAVKRILDAACPLGHCQQKGTPMATTTARKHPCIDAADIARLRAMSVNDTLNLLGLYAKLDRDYQPHKNTQSKRVNVSVDSTVIELVVTGAKWYDARAQHGGGGAIDLTMHLYREPFVKAMQRLQSRERAIQ